MPKLLKILRFMKTNCPDTNSSRSREYYICSVNVLRQVKSSLIYCKLSNSLDASHFTKQVFEDFWWVTCHCQHCLILQNYFFKMTFKRVQDDQLKFKPSIRMGKKWFTWLWMWYGPCCWCLSGSEAADLHGFNNLVLNYINKESSQKQAKFILVIPSIQLKKNTPPFFWK